MNKAELTQLLSTINVTQIFEGWPRGCQCGCQGHYTTDVSRFEYKIDAAKKLSGAKFNAYVQTIDNKTSVLTVRNGNKKFEFYFEVSELC